MNAEFQRIARRDKKAFLSNQCKEIAEKNRMGKTGDLQAGFRKGRGTREQMPTSAGSWKKEESSRKTSISALLTMPKPLTVWITINCGKF